MNKQPEIVAYYGAMAFFVCLHRSNFSCGKVIFPFSGLHKPDADDFRNLMTLFPSKMGTGKDQLTSLTKVS